MKCIYSLLLTTSGATTVLQSIIFLLWIVAIASQLVWMSLSSTAWCQYIAHWDAVILAVSYHLLFKSIWWLFTSLRVKAKVFTTPTRSSMTWLLLSSFLYLLWLILWFILLLSHWPPIVSCIWWTHCCFRPFDRCPLYLNCSLSLYTHTHTHTRSFRWFHGLSPCLLQVFELLFYRLQLPWLPYFKSQCFLSSQMPHTPSFVIFQYDRPNQDQKDCNTSFLPQLIPAAPVIQHWCGNW